jgi:hypothetical protein
MKSHKKAFGFSWISLSESSLFKDLRRPLGPEILCRPPQPLGRRRAPPEGAASPLSPWPPLSPRRAARKSVPAATPARAPQAGARARAPFRPSCLPRLAAGWRALLTERIIIALMRKNGKRNLGFSRPRPLGWRRAPRPAGRSVRDGLVATMREGMLNSGRPRRASLGARLTTGY